MENSSEFFDIPSAVPPEGQTDRERVFASPQGYCEIWRCDRAGRFRALKCLKEEFRGNPLYESLLRKEFEIGYSLSHGNICEYYAFSDDPELGSYIEMEWVDGRTLEAYFAEGKHERSVHEKIVEELCLALSYMHAKQVLHRDLKPSNILVTYNGDNVKLIDFGLSDTDASSVLKTPAGTAVYAAPEVRSGGKASVRSDLYSLGTVMSLFPVRRFARIARRLRASRPEDRPASVAEVEKALKSNTPVVQAAVFLLLVALMALFPALEKCSGPSGIDPAPEPAAVTDSTADSLKAAPMPAPVAQDTTIKTDPAPAPAASKSQGKPEAKTPKAPAVKDTATHKTDQRVIDELFRQATELFE